MYRCWLRCIVVLGWFPGGKVIMSHGILIAGLILFLGIHLMLALDRERVESLKLSLGANAWRGIHSLVAVVGLVLIIWGFGLSRAEPVFIWQPPLWTRHVAALFSEAAIFFLVAALIPRNYFKAKFGHPLFIAIKLWAFAHLLANGRLGDMLLFGSFLIWSIIGFTRARRRDRLAGTVWPSSAWSGTTITVIVGLIFSAAIMFWLHERLIGVPVV